MFKAVSRRFIVVLVVMMLIMTSTSAFAQDEDGLMINSVDVVNESLTLINATTPDGRPVEGMIVNGPSEPPAEYEAERQASIQPLPREGVISNFPSFSWVFGCSAVSGAMIAAYQDRNGFGKIYTGPTNGGVYPLTDTSWAKWSDGYSTYPNNPLIASHKGVDGRTTRGSIDDYWIKSGSTANDPYITGGWTQHAWGSAIGDYMKTSQSAYSNPDGSTVFYTPGDSSKFTCAYMESNGMSRDGNLGRSKFYKAKGYTVTECYNQAVDNPATGAIEGFTMAQFKAEIDAKRPVFISLYGHSIVGYGYGSGNTIYIRDTWDNNPSHTYTMQWGGSYSGMQMRGVRILKISGSTPTGGFNSQFTSNANGWKPVKGYWSVGGGNYKTSSLISGGFASAKHDNTYGVLTYTVRIKATGCSSCSHGLYFNGTPYPVSSTGRWNKGYGFYLTNNDQYSIWRYDGGVATAIVGWTDYAPISSDWNVLKVTYNKANGFVQFFINGTRVVYGSFNSYKSGVVGLAFARDSTASTFYTDYAVLTTNAPKSEGALSEGFFVDEAAVRGVSVPDGDLGTQ